MSDTTTSPKSSPSPLAPHGQTTPTSSTGTIPKYSDLDADLVLVSAEGKKFRVHLYVLKANSSYFFNLLSQPHPDPIKLDLSFKLLRKILDGLHLRSLPGEFVWVYRDALFAACDKYQFNLVAERALLSLLDVVDKDPWEVFCLASKRAHYGVAKAALRALAFQEKVEGKEKPEIDNLTPQLAEKVAMLYLLGLFHAALKWNQLSGQAKKGDREMDWKFIANNFEPVRNQFAI